MDRTTIARSLQPLERDVNISVTGGEKDRRNKIIAITPYSSPMTSLLLRPPLPH